jgi:hypothetical protein
MENVKEIISSLTENGINFNMKLIGDVKTGGFLKQVGEFESEEGIANWIILREMGTNCTWLNNINHKERYSDDISTINFGDYFFNNKISSLFQELSRITKGSFEFEVINEFEPIYDPNHNIIEQEFWNELDRLKGNFEYICKYVIMGREIEIKYEFHKREWTSLNPNFINELLSTLQNDLANLNVNCLEPEEFITFIVCDEKTKNKLKIDLGVSFHEKKLPTHQEEESIKNIQELENEEPEIREIEKKKWWKFWK